MAGPNVSFIQRFHCNLSHLTGPSGGSSGGVNYVCWGSSTCPSVPGTTLVYTGTVGGSHHRQRGGAANHLCMPPDPDYSLNVQSGFQDPGAYLYGNGYQKPYSGSRRMDTNIPCAVCFVATQASVLMIPAKTTCPTGWTMQYNGYLMTERTHDASQPIDV